jgi:acetylornithine deacetylase
MNHEKLLSDLIEIKSYSGEEKNLRRYIKSWFKERNIDSFEQDDNLIVHFEGKDRSKAFIFNSHMDTVDSGELEWKYGPWNPTIEDEKLVGLGASDMKSGLTTSMLLAEHVAQGKPKVDMWFTYVAKEEVDGSGTANFAGWFAGQKFDKQYSDLAGIFTEPTSLKEIEHGHRGNLFLIARSEGDSKHSSRPDEVVGIPAVRKMIGFSNKFQKNVESWNKNYPSTYFNPAITLGEFTSIQAGVGIQNKDNSQIISPTSPNKFPSVCTATFDLRTTPEFHPQALEKVAKLAIDEDLEVKLLYPDAPAGFTDPSEKIIRVARNTIIKAELTVSQGSADLGFLTAVGVKAVILGPGEKLQAHATNEFCYPDQIPQAVDVYKAIVDAWSEQ